MTTPKWTMPTKRMKLKKGEIFVPAFGIPGIRVSNLGRVWSDRRNIFLKLHLSNKGYPRLATVAYGKPKQIHVHRLMRQSFDNKDRPGFHVAHLNGIPHDNRLENLQWTTPQENSQHRIIHGTDANGQRNSQAQLKETQVIEIMRLNQRGFSKERISLELGIARTKVNAILWGETWNRITGIPRKRKPYVSIFKSK